MPAMAIPPPLNCCGMALTLPMAMMPRTSPATAIGEPMNTQQQLGIDRMPSTIDVMASGWNFGPIIIMPGGPPGGPKPPGGGPKPPGGGPKPPPGGGP